MDAKTYTYINSYRIDQRVGGSREETAISSLQVEFHMFSTDTHSTKHEEFLNDLRMFLETRNKSTES